MEARDGKIVDAFNTISESRQEGRRNESGGMRERGRGKESGERQRGRKRGRDRHEE